jgi:hypothetical protein
MHIFVGTPSLPPSAAGDAIPTSSPASPSVATPSFELPPEFQSYNGPPEDRKAFLAWKKSRAEALEALERMK